MHVAGRNVSGAPGIVAGHNTTSPGARPTWTDVQDVYIEKFDKDIRIVTSHPQVCHAEVRHEQINVRKNPIDPKSIVTQTLDVTVTRHGPIILEKMECDTHCVGRAWSGDS